MYPTINMRFPRDVLFFSVHKERFACIQVLGKPPVRGESIHMHFLCRRKIAKKSRLAILDVVNLRETERKEKLGKVKRLFREDYLSCSGHDQTKGTSTGSLHRYVHYRGKIIHKKNVWDLAELAHNIRETENKQIQRNEWRNSVMHHRAEFCILFGLGAKRRTSNEYSWFFDGQLWKLEYWWSKFSNEFLANY